MANKQYGLIIPSKKKNSLKLQSRTLNPLLNSDDELERDDDKDEQALDWVEASMKKSAGNSGQQSLQKRLLREAFKEDSSVFQYDEVYDDMKAAQEEELEKKRELQQRKPKYIETILKHTEKRKLENERRLERKVQKEREAEGSQFADKESFVTPSYLKKLEELKKAEEEENLEKLIEEKQDLHKHKNFGVFYNHLFKQRIRESKETVVKEEPLDPDDDNAAPNSPKLKKHYRTQEDLSDDEPCQQTALLPIKKEPGVSNSEGSDEEERNIHENKKRKDLEGRTEDDCKKKQRRERGRSHSEERERVTHDNKKRREGDERTGDKSREKQRHYRRRSRSKSRSKDRHNKYYDRDRDRKSRSNGDPERSNRERSRERKFKHPSGRRERSRERNDRSRNGRENKDRKRRSSSRDMRREKDDEIKSKNNYEEKSKSERKKIRESEKVNHNRKDEKEKLKTETKSGQSINTRLGVTDVNKMNIEDRIKRFCGVFAKRTVGQTFEDAVQRYFARKAEREASNLL